MLGLGANALPPMFYSIILSAGISFYTFQSMSYSIDLYRGHARPAPDFLSFACYISMFLQLVAGPIRWRKTTLSHTELGCHSIFFAIRCAHLRGDQTSDADGPRRIVSEFVLCDFVRGGASQLGVPRCSCSNRSVIAIVSELPA